MDMNKLRQRTDRAMIACVKEDGGHYVYFSRPPLKEFTLCFTDRHVEKDYRRTAWRANNKYNHRHHRGSDGLESVSSSN